MISIKNLVVKVEKKIILNKISLNFNEEKIYAILGVNGSGKSTLIKAIMGDPNFKISKKSEIKLNDKSIKNWEVNKRAENGIFISFQNPPEISGVSVKQMLRAITKNKNLTTKELLAKIENYSQQLKIKPELLNRSLNEGFSGGERKKMELLQMAILNPDYIFLDEIDTGVDVDALKIIANFLKNFIKGTKKTLIIISHQNKIFNELQPERVFVFKNGKIVKEGDFNLIKEVEEKGYEKF